MVAQALCFFNSFWNWDRASNVILVAAGERGSMEGWKGGKAIKLYTSKNPSEAFGN
jgi:hypothetical protein